MSNPEEQPRPRRRTRPIRPASPQPGAGMSRRQFLAAGASVAAGGLLINRLPAMIGAAGPTQEGPPQGAPDSYDPTQHDWAFVVDSRKCIGCGRCVVACKRENNVPWPEEYNRTWVERYVYFQDGETYVDSPEAGREGFSDKPLPDKYQGLDVKRSFFVPKLCNQCEKPPCVQVCPVAATYKTRDGVILVNWDHCIGCRYCIQACPYGARYLHPVQKVADKCTWCYHRITKGLKPACVDACPVGARLFGDLNNPDDMITEIVEQERVSVLKPEMGTKPQVRYLGIDEGVR